MDTSLALPTPAEPRASAKLVYSQVTDMLEKDKVAEDVLKKPDDEEAKQTTDRTRAALEKMISGRIASATPKNAPTHEKLKPAYVQYTPSAQGGDFNSGQKERVIRLTEMPTDPLDPPRFKHKKLPGRSNSPPVPIMHSPPRKLTFQDQQNWKIPPAVSNWKNIKGYTIPLDKRLAADGRRLEEPQISDKFAKLSESLFSAERMARKELVERDSMRQRINKQQKEAKEQKLRALAQKIRTQRRTGTGAPDATDGGDAAAAAAGPSAGERDELRAERRRERQRELRMDTTGKRARVDRDRDRDISEVIALGKPMPKSSAGQFDQRLFNQSQGLDSGFGADDSYTAFTKPLFKDGFDFGLDKFMSDAKVGASAAAGGEAQK